MKPMRFLMARGRARLSTWRQPAVVCLGPCGPTDDEQAPDFGLVPSHDQALAAWQRWCLAHAGQRCRLALSSQWLLSCLVAQEEGAKARRWRSTFLEEAVARAAQQWEHYLSLDAITLHRDWVLRPARVEGGVLVCAAPRVLVDDLLAMARHHGVRVVWLGPWWAAGLHRWLGNPASVADVLTVHEPGWSLHFERSGRALQRLWMQQDGSIAPTQQTGLVLDGAGLVDDMATAALVQGRADLWRGVA